MTPKQISEALANQVLQVCQELLPGGRKEGNEWRAGSTEGEHGKSLGVHLSGQKAGVWCDFAEGTSGDLLDLWCEVRSITLPEAIKQAKAYLGVKEPTFYRNTAKKKTYAQPKKPKCSATAPELEWLKGRGLSDETLKRFKIAGSDNKVYFPFIREDKAVMVKWRDINSKDTMPTSKNQEPILFGWQAIPNNAREVTICEGEIDAMSLHQMGFPALSVPFGGGKGAKQQWIENEYDQLERFDLINVCMDTDEVGKEAAREIIERLGSHRCRFVNLPAKDANECLQQGVPISLVAEAIQNAATLDPSELRAASGFADEIFLELHPEHKPIEEEHLSLIGNKHAEDFAFRPEEMIGITGVNGHGKSQWLGNLIVESMRTDYRWCIASMEMPAEKFLGRMTRQASGMKKPSREYINAISEWYDDKLWVFNVVGNAKGNRILEVFEYAHKRYGVNHFVIDSLMMCDMADDDYAGQKALLQKIADFKNKFKVTVFIVLHPRKLENENASPGKFDVLGGIAITNLLDTGISIWRNKKKESIIQGDTQSDMTEEDVLSMPDCKAVIWKQRNGDGWEGKAHYWFDPKSMQYRITPRAKPIQYVKFSTLHSVA